MASALCAVADSCLLANTILSDEVVRGIEEKTIDDPATVLALVEFVANLAINTFRRYSLQRYKEFDSNPADEACQSRVAVLIHFSTLGVLEQLGELEKACLKIKKKVDTKSSQQSLDRADCAAFFKSMLGELRVSKEVEFLLHARLLTITCIRETNAEGERKVFSLLSNLDVVTKKISRIEAAIRHRIFNHSQILHSRQSIAYMHQLAKDKLAIKMSEEEQIFRPKLTGGFEPKHFSCHYFEVMTLLDQVEEKGVAIALRSIRKEDKPFAFFRGGRFMQDPPGLDEMVLVVEGTLKGSPEEICAEVAKTSVREMILVDVSKGPPFHLESTLDDIKEPQARRVIEEMRSKEVVTTFDLVHTYLNLVKFEVK